MAIRSHNYAEIFDGLTDAYMGYSIKKDTHRKIARSICMRMINNDSLDLNEDEADVVNRYVYMV